MQKIVLDTNVLLVSISDRSKHHWIFKSLLGGDYTLCVTTDILTEYAEIIEQHMGHWANENTLATLENLPNIELVTSYYRFGLLKDQDDNKFVDCAIACNTNFIVSHDNDFNILKQIDLPKVIVINTDSFQQLLNNTI